MLMKIQVLHLVAPGCVVKKWLFDPEDEGTILSWNVGKYQQIWHNIPEDFNLQLFLHHHLTLPTCTVLWTYSMNTFI